MSMGNCKIEILGLTQKRFQVNQAIEHVIRLVVEDTSKADTGVRRQRDFKVPGVTCK